jgi:transcriptional regulator with XRE-family HTH domain
MKRKAKTNGNSAKMSKVQCQLGKVLRDWRTTKALPLKHVASDLGVSISVVSQWERAKRFPSMQNLLQISEYTKIPVSDFFCMRKCPFRKK